MSKLLQPLIDKWEKWRRHRKYPENKFFKIVTDEKYDGLLAIEILKGDYQGVLYTYGPISVDEELGYKGARASFDYNIINSNLSLDERHRLSNDEKLGKIVGEILLIALEKVVKHQADTFAKENLDEEVRENYFEEPVPQRTVSKKDSTVSKKRVSSGKKRKTGTRRSSKVRSSVQPKSDD